MRKEEMASAVRRWLEGYFKIYVTDSDIELLAASLGVTSGIARETIRGVIRGATSPGTEGADER